MSHNIDRAVLVSVDKEGNRVIGGSVHAGSTSRGRLTTQTVGVRLQNGGHTGKKP